ncbi:MAG: hypothetical protein M3Y08_01215 [Fibrobacterota bacterium]|nr:hypothetical protein [Fibrobacterota bacterium]
MPKKPKDQGRKKNEFVTVQVRPEVLVLLRQVEDEFQELHSVRPTHSITFVNALTHYKNAILAA